MDDRELLDLAAKAAGYKVRWHDNWRCFVHSEPHNIDNPPTLAGDRHVWAPLEDDGDAFRLSVDLQISILSNIIRYEASTIELTLARVFVREDMINQRPRIAARRAIVRAAAEIGKAL